MNISKTNKPFALILALIAAVSFVATPVAFAGDRNEAKPKQSAIPTKAAAKKLPNEFTGIPEATPVDQMIAIDTTPTGNDPNKKKLQQLATAADPTASATPDPTVEAKAGIVAEIRRMAKAKIDEITAEKDDVSSKYNELVKGYNNLLTQLNTANGDKAKLQANYNVLAAALDGADDIKTTLKPKENPAPTVVKK